MHRVVQGDCSIVTVSQLPETLSWTMAGALREGTGQISEVDSGKDFDF
jgi:hypothetical protein